MRIVALNCQPEAVLALNAACEAFEAGFGSLSIVPCANFADGARNGELARADVVAVQAGTPAIRDLPDQLRSHDLKPSIIGMRRERQSLSFTFDLWDGQAEYGIEGLLTHQLGGVLHAIYERHRAPQRMAELEEMVESKNGEIAKLTDSAYRCFDQLAHEFRTPLTVIRDYAELIRDGFAGPTSRKQKEYLTAIQDRNEELSCLIDDMLDIRRSQMGVLTLRRQPIDLGPKVAAAVARLKRRASSKGIEIDLQIPSVLPRAFCDVERIQRIVFNLILNSLKYSEQGGSVRVTVDALDEEHSIAIRVHDTFGAEIDRADSAPSQGDDDRDRLLEEFEQARVGFDVTRGSVFGPGLGIARDILRQSFGDFSINSDPQSGTTMTLMVPTYDVPSLVERFLNSQSDRDRTPSQTVLFRIRPSQVVDVNPAPVIDDFIQHAQGANGFVVPTNGHNWLWMLAGTPDEETELVTALQNRWQRIREDLPLTEMPDLVFERIVSWNTRIDRDVIVKSVHAAFDHLRALEPPRPRVLLADDDLESLAGLVSRLEAFGYEVTSAINMQHCLQAALAEHPDAILIDAGLAQGEGQDAYDALMKGDETMNVPILMLADGIRDQQRALEQGTRHVIGKHHDARQLRSTLEELLSTT